MIDRIRCIIINPGKPPKLFYMNRKTVKRMTDYRLLVTRFAVIVTDSGEGKPNGRLYGIPLYGKVVICGSMLIDGAFTPWHLTHEVTLENFGQITGYTRDGG